MFIDLILLGLACLLAPWLAKLAGYEWKHKAFGLVGTGGIFFLLTAAFGLGMVLLSAPGGIGRVLVTISLLLGCLSLTVGAIWSTANVLREHELTVRPVVP